MKTIYRNLIIACCLVFSLSLVAYPQAQQGEKSEKTDKKKKDKEEKKGGVVDKVTGIFGGKSDAEKAAEAEKDAEKAEREYQKLKASALKKYNNDPSFKIRVDEEYRQVRRQHSEMAFKINTYDSNDERITFTGDKLKSEDTLYDNPLVQDYINRVGQALVPESSKFRYAFKVVLNPVPDARSLSTGTVYITTGLLSIVDNEAQLSYILAHEIAHIENKHWFQDALVANEIEDYNNKQEKLRSGISAVTSIATFGMGSLATGSLFRGLGYAWLANWGASSVMKFVAPSKVFSWDRNQENEADEFGVKRMFEKNYDPREVPKLYARLESFSQREPRAQEGFLAQVDRISERLNYVNPFIVPLAPTAMMVRGTVNLRDRRPSDSADASLVSPLESGKPFGTSDEADRREKAAAKQINNSEISQKLKEKLDRGELIGSGPEFESVMADLKRDNGIRAFYYDMFQMAIQNLSEALQIRSNDPYTHYYYGKVRNLTARNKADKADALKSFETSISLDKRKVLANPWLQKALALMADRNAALYPEIISALKQYVEIYQQENGGQLPANMDAIYAYMKDLGEEKWVARPAMNISTKNIDPINTAESSRWQVGQPPATAPGVKNGPSRPASKP